jgi:hypothetical protein
MGKDLIAEKIIQDLEVFCVNQLCDWKDCLENLNKHVKACPFAETPAWLSKAQSNLPPEQVFDSVGDIYLQADEHYQERLNEEVPRKSLLERLYTRNLESKELVNTVFNTSITEEPSEEQEQENSSKKKVRGGRAKGKGKGKAQAQAKVETKPKIEIQKSTSLMKDYDDFLCAIDDSDDEETKDPETQTEENSSKKKSSQSKEEEKENHLGGLGQALDFESAKGSLERISTSETGGAIEEEFDAETLLNNVYAPTNVNGKRKSTRRKAHEPSVIKKYQVGAI